MSSSDSEVFIIAKYTPKTWQSFAAPSKYMTHAERKAVITAMNSFASLATLPHLESALAAGASWCTWGFLEGYTDPTPGTSTEIVKAFPLGTYFYSTKCTETDGKLAVNQVNVPLDTLSVGVSHVGTDDKGNVTFYGYKPHPDRPTPLGATWSTRFSDDGRNAVQLRLTPSSPWVYEIIPFNEQRYFQTLRHNFDSRSYFPREYSVSSAGNEAAFIGCLIVALIIGIGFLVAAMYYRSKLNKPPQTVQSRSPEAGLPGSDSSIFDPL